MSGRMYWRQQAVPVLLQVLCLSAGLGSYMVSDPAPWDGLYGRSCAVESDLFSQKKEVFS